MSEGRGPRAYAVAVCEGRRRVAVRDLDGLPGGPPTAAEARGFLGWLAAELRARGGLGRAVLLDRRTLAVVAERRVWP